MTARADVRGLEPALGVYIFVTPVLQLVVFGYAVTSVPAVVAISRPRQRAVGPLCPTRPGPPSGRARHSVRTEW